MKLRDSDPRTRIFTIGSIIWRRVQFYGRDYEPVLADSNWEVTPKGQFGSRVQLPGHFLHELESGGNSGLMLFCNEEPEEDWTCLVITGTSTRIKQGGAGGAIFAAMPPHSLFSVEEYLDWRQKYALAIAKNNKKELTFAEKVELAKRLTITTHPRLVIERLATGNYRYQYELVQDRKAYDNYWAVYNP